MPSCNSWNGRWSGESQLYARTRSFRGKAREAFAKTLAEKGYFHYSFSDGWSAGIAVREIDGAESRKLTRKSDGFCGYDWMIDSILRDGKIIAPSDRQEAAE